MAPSGVAQGSFAKLAKSGSNFLSGEYNFGLFSYNKSLSLNSARPGHDLRYTPSGDYLPGLGWEPQVSLRERLEQVGHWSLENKMRLQN